MLLHLILFSPALHKALWLDPALAAGIVELNLGKEACFFVIGGRLA
jgi:hypothetical protein